MAALPPCTAWLQHPLGEALLRFDQLPSLWLHPAQLAQHVPAAACALLEAAAPGSAAWHRWHRHGSQALARSLDLPPVAGLDSAGLALALLPAARWDQLLLWSGALLAGAPLRRAIARDRVQSLRAQLGDAFDFVRTPQALALYPGHPEDPTPATAAACAQAGAALLACALQAADPAVAARARLRMAPGTSPAAGLTAQQALQLACCLIEQIDPPWLSNFPATR